MNNSGFNKLALKITPFLFFISSVFVVNQTFAKGLITWRVTDWPPFYILSGPNKGQGIYDQLISMFSQEMPEYEHHILQMNTDRVKKAWAFGANICHPSVIKGTAENISVINTILLPHRLIMRSNQQRIKEDSVKLKELLSNDKLIGGITPGRYTNQINHLIEQASPQEHLVKFHSYKSLILMLFAQRVDYIIEYPPIVTFIATETGQKNITKSLLIEETSAENSLAVVVGCTNNEWGKKVINKINQILIAESKNSKFLDYRLKWYDESSKLLLRKLYKDNYLNDKR